MYVMCLLESLIERREGGRKYPEHPLPPPPPPLPLATILYYRTHIYEVKYN